MFAAPKAHKDKTDKPDPCDRCEKELHNPRSAVTPLSVSTKWFPNRATMPSPTKRLNIIAMEKSMYPSPPCAAERRRSPRSKSALQSSRAPSTKNEIAAKIAMTIFGTADGRHLWVSAGDGSILQSNAQNP
jgi:hypothetical protein